MGETEQQSKVILYWLNYSRSQRILWLLEELNVKYELKVFERDELFRCPEEMKKIYPLGKSPVLSVDGKVIAESGFITQYLLSKFDTERKLTPTDENDKLDVDYYLHYSEGTLQPLLLGFYILDTDNGIIPWAQKADKVLDYYYYPELQTNLDFLESRLENKEYFVGGKLTGADIMLSFPILSCFDPQFVKLNKPYPNLQKWLERINSNKTKQRSDELVKNYQ